MPKNSPTATENVTARRTACPDTTVVNASSVFTATQLPFHCSAYLPSMKPVE